MTDGGDVSIALAGNPARYTRLPGAVVNRLRRLGDSPFGMTRPEAARVGFTETELQALLDAGLVLPATPETQAPRSIDTIAIWARLIRSRLAVARRGWAAVEPFLTTPAGRMPISRPLRFDQIESAARLSRGLPGAVSRCTETAMAICGQLRSEGFAARISLRVFTAPSGMHAQAQVGDHVIDPNDWRTEAPAMTRFS